MVLGQTQSLQRSRGIQGLQKNTIQAEMVESEGIQELLNQATIQAVTVVMMAPKELEVEPQPATASTREPPRLRYSE